jgi:hypothetical protein
MIVTRKGFLTTAKRLVPASLAPVALLLLFALSAGRASAATPGSLAFEGCLVDISGGDSCGGTAAGLNRADAVAVSPDRANVYVAAEEGGVAVFDRGAGGALSFASCFTGRGAPGCTSYNGLELADAVAVSGDGTNVYVLSSGVLATFARHADGSLTPTGCIQDPPSSPPCTALPSGSTLTRASTGGAVMVSPDGSHVYTVTAENGGLNGAVDVFSRGAAGALTSDGCIEASHGSGTACVTKAPGLSGAGAASVLGSGYLFVNAYNTSRPSRWSPTVRSRSRAVSARPPGARRPPPEAPSATMAPVTASR